MGISERLLRKWRKDILKEVNNEQIGIHSVKEPRSELYKKILRMTQELLDQHLLKK